jgi:hypothetical protein
MSWIIRAMPKLDLFEPLEGFRVGDGVEVMPWEGQEVNIGYKNVLAIGGPKGIVRERRENSSYGDIARIEFVSASYWVKVGRLRHI